MPQVTGLPSHSATLVWRAATSCIPAEKYRSYLPKVAIIMLAGALLAAALHVMAGQAAGGPRDFNYRIPLRWSSENDS